MSRALRRGREAGVGPGSEYAAGEHEQGLGEYCFPYPNFFYARINENGGIQKFNAMDLSVERDTLGAAGSRLIQIGARIDF